MQRNHLPMRSLYPIIDQTTIRFLLRYACGFFPKRLYWNTRLTTSRPHIRSLLWILLQGIVLEHTADNIMTTHTISSPLRLRILLQEIVLEHRRQHHDTYDLFHGFFSKEMYWNT